MSLDTQIASLIEVLNAGFPPLQHTTGEEARAAIRSRFFPNANPEPVAEVTDRDIPVERGSITVWSHRPDVAGNLPILVHAHGSPEVIVRDRVCHSFCAL